MQQQRTHKNEHIKSKIRNYVVIDEILEIDY